MQPLMLLPVLYAAADNATLLVRLCSFCRSRAAESTSTSNQYDPARQ